MLSATITQCHRSIPVTTTVPRGEAFVPWPPLQTLKMKNVKQNQAVLAKAKLVFCEYSGFVLDLDFSLKNPRMVMPSALPIKLICDVTRL